MTAFYRKEERKDWQQMNFSDIFKKDFLATYANGSVSVRENKYSSWIYGGRFKSGRSPVKQSQIKKDNGRNNE